MSAAKKTASQLELAPVEPIGADELILLRGAPYDMPRAISGSHEAKLADALVAAGLLERDSSAPRFVRCTARGEEVARSLSLTRARLAVQEIRVAAEEGDPEAAASLEQRLHVRVLAETAAAGYLAGGPARAASLARIALTTTSIRFRR